MWIHNLKSHHQYFILNKNVIHHVEKYLSHFLLPLCPSLSHFTPFYIIFKIIFTNILKYPAWPTLSSITLTNNKNSWQWLIHLLLMSWWLWRFHQILVFVVSNQSCPLYKAVLWMAITGIWSYNKYTAYTLSNQDLEANFHSLQYWQFFLCHCPQTLILNQKGVLCNKWHGRERILWQEVIDFNQKNHLDM